MNAALSFCDMQLSLDVRFNFVEPVAEVDFQSSDMALPIKFDIDDEPLDLEFDQEDLLLQSELSELDNIVDIEFADFQQINIGTNAPIYDGTYSVVPDTTPQTLLTANRLLTDNVQVLEIPFFCVSNQTGGNTVYIGKEIENGS